MAAKKEMSDDLAERRFLLAFLADLRSHNGRDWFEANRPRYERAREAFMRLVGELLGRFGEVDDLGGVTVKECVFRINRDVRFSKDKTPYKTAMSALLGRGGRKSNARNYYFHVEPDGGSFLAGGLYAPSADELAQVRQDLARDAKPFRKIILAPAFEAQFGGLGGESLKTAPQGYPKDHPEIELLRRKQFFVSHPLDDKLVLSPELLPESLKVFKVMKPFVAYLESTLAE